MISSILRPLWQTQPTVCTSTEEMIAAIEETNRKQIDKHTTIGSADVKALYPSLNIDFTAEKVSEMFVDSDLTVEIDHEELGLYLSLNTNREELEKEDLTQYCPERKTKQGRKPTVTGCALNEDKGIRHGPWKEPQATPDDTTKKRMIALALKIVIKLIMNNHIYVFDNNIRRQKEGGPIGLELTGDVAQVVMAWWDREMLKRLREEGKLEVLMYKRYVDDINTAVRNKQDTRESNEERGEKEDTTNMKLFKETGNKINPCIQLEVDSPSMHEDMKMPILDLKVWTEEIEGRGYNIIYEFYCKDISSKAVVHARSSLSWASKRTIMTQEILRIMLNCSQNLPWQRVAQFISHFMARMQYSGYNQKFRSEVVQSAIKAMKNLIEKEKKGERPIHRPKEWRRREREKERRAKRTGWFRKGGHETVIFIPATKESKLKTNLEEIVRRSKVKVKIIEKNTKTIKSILTKPDPFTDRKCSDSTCMVCTTKEGGKGVSCRKEGVTYEIECREEGCGAKYIGETSSNAYTRGREHLQALQHHHTSSPLWKHTENAHKHSTPKYSMKVTGIYKHDATLRQISEAVKINTAPQDKLLNDKSEWGHTPLARTVIEIS